MATPLFVVSFIERWEGTEDILVQFAAQNEAAETKAPVKFYMCLCLKRLLSVSLVITHCGCLLLSEKEVILLSVQSYASILPTESICSMLFTKNLHF